VSGTSKTLYNNYLVNEMRLLVNIPFYDRTFDTYGGDLTDKSDKYAYFMNEHLNKTSSIRRDAVYHTLSKTLKEINKYEVFSEINVRIDTNSKIQASNFNLKELTLKPKFKIDIIHHSVKNPFLLTWVHRSFVAANIANYDWVMYLEDDIIVPVSSVNEYMKWSVSLYKYRNKLLHFVRVVKDKNEKMFFGDLRRPVRYTELFKFNDSLFGSMSYSYSAVWMYPKIIMKDFVKHQDWSRPRIKHDLRASASFGFMNHPMCNTKCLITIYPCDNLKVFHVLASGKWYHRSHTTSLAFKNGTGWVFSK